MLRRFLCCLLLVTCLSQAWAATDMGATMAVPSHAQSDCAGHMDSGDEGLDCCPDGMTATAGCASLCAASADIANPPLAPAVAPDAAPLDYLPAPLPGPRYIPLNPPPIA